MVFEFTVTPEFNFVDSFAEKLDVPVYKNALSLPTSLGDGYIKKIVLESDLKLVIHHYTLREKLHLKRIVPKESNKLISIIFNSQEIPSSQNADKQRAIQFLKDNGSAIQIASSSLATESLFSANSKVYFAVIGITPKLLTSLLQLEQTNSLVTTILNSETAFFYHETMTAEAQRLLRQLTEIHNQHALGNLYYRIKIHQLLYLLFSKLLNREANHQSAINKADLDRLYTIRTSIVHDLSSPPQLRELAKNAGMSETKTKQLFKQVFGDTVYNYYQKARMEEAAFLLKQAGYSVSETGYQLGFSNLSHFSRIFERHFGITPKKYSITV